jgi:hypothetical protein
MVWDGTYNGYPLPQLIIGFVAEVLIWTGYKGDSFCIERWPHYNINRISRQETTDKYNITLLLPLIYK